MNKLMTTSLILLAALCLPYLSNAAAISSEQLKFVQKLSPQEQASLAKQAGITLPATKAMNPLISSPNTVMKREVNSQEGSKSIVATTADVAMQSKEVAQSSQTDVPLKQLSKGSQTAETLEVRRALSDFMRESKPLKVDASNLRKFGYDLFAGVPTTFAPATDVPVPAEYVLGPGDELEVQIFGLKNEIFTLIVDREGTVAFPGLGPLTLVGMSFSEVKAFIAQQIGDKMVGASVSVAMGKLRSIRIFALGDVERPGSYVVSGLATLSHALFVSGGVKQVGSLRNVQLKRKGEVIVTLDLYDFLLQGDTSKDVRLLPGDVVFVPPIGRTAAIAGQVVRPAIYELQGKADINTMVKLAGGYLPKAYREKALLERINSSGYKSVKDFPLSGESLKISVENGDVIKVFAALDFEENLLLLIGNVQRPGKYAWEKGMQLSDLLTDKSVLLPETFMDYAVIEREASGNREPEIIRFKLSTLFLKDKQDMKLQPRDKIFVFHRSHFRIAPKVSVAGSVKTPGAYELKKGMRLLDLILASGGLVRDTDLEEAELYRTDPKSKDVIVSRFTLSEVMSGEIEKNIELQDLDRIVVHSIWEKTYKNYVNIQGEVKKPGQFQIGVGMRLSDLVFAAGGVTRDVLMEDVQIYRTDEETKEVSLLVANLSSALSGDMQQNIELQDLDRIVVHSIWEKTYKNYVNIQGEVKKPGQFQIGVGMRLSDLVFAAGGVTRDVLMEDVQIYRTDEETKEVSLLVANLSSALSGDMQQNIELQDLDRIVVHSIWEKTYKNYVNIQGEVKKPGQFQIGVGMRLSDLVFAAGGVTRDVLMEDVQIYRTDEETKEVSLLVANLSSALAGDMQQNIELQDLDRIVVHSIWEKKRKYNVRISGEVMKPGDYVFAEKGMHLLDLLYAAGGVTEKAFLGHAEITRYDVIDDEVRESTHFEVDLEQALAGDMYANIALQPYDVLMVRPLSNWRVSELVKVTGEVKYPGTYPIEDGEHLSSLLTRAGGYADKAYLEAAVFTRESIRVQQAKQMQDMTQQIESEVAQLEISIAGIKEPSLYATKQKSLQAAKRVLEQMKAVKALGRLVIKLSDIALLKKSSFDMTLRDGDAIHIPKKPDQVLVMGQVYNSTAFVYEKGMGEDDYIALAGGMTRMADESRIYIVRASGRVDAVSSWWGESIAPGDTIVVPEDLERFYLLDSVLDWSKVLMNIGVSTAAMKTIGIF